MIGLNVNCVITDAICRKGPKDLRLYDLTLYDFERAEPVVSRFNPNGGSKALHHVTLIDDGSSDSQMMRFARALDITSSLDEFRKKRVRRFWYGMFIFKRFGGIFGL